MKKWILGIGCLLVAMTVLAEEQVFRAFTSKDGRSIEARIIEYNPSRNQLRIERRGKGSSWVGGDVFSEKDREYIKQWISASTFLSERNLRVSLQKKKGTASTRGRRTSGGTILGESEIQKLYFEIKIRNSSAGPIEKLNIEYCYYVKIKGTGGRSSIRRKSLGLEDDLIRIEAGSFITGVLGDGNEKIYRSKRLFLETQYTKKNDNDENIINAPSTTYMEKISEEEFCGIWIRIYGPKVEGIALCRDLTYPRNLSDNYYWKGGLIVDESLFDFED